MIDPEVRVQIRRYFYAEHWKEGTIAQTLRLHPDAPPSFKNTISVPLSKVAICDDDRFMVDLSIKARLRNDEDAAVTLSSHGNAVLVTDAVGRITILGSAVDVFSGLGTSRGDESENQRCIPHRKRTGLEGSRNLVNELPHMKHFKSRAIIRF
jgi:hypothetical protein